MGLLARCGETSGQPYLLSTNCVTLVVTCASVPLRLTLPPIGLKQLYTQHIACQGCHILLLLRLFLLGSAFFPKGSMPRRPPMSDRNPYELFKQLLQMLLAQNSMQNLCQLLLVCAVTGKILTLSLTNWLQRLGLSENFATKGQILGTKSKRSFSIMPVKIILASMPMSIRAPSYDHHLHQEILGTIPGLLIYIPWVQ